MRAASSLSASCEEPELFVQVQRCVFKKLMFGDGGALHFISATKEIPQCTIQTRTIMISALKIMTVT
jgi:hypothetical protein